jgi:hypothetical protein
MSTNQATGQTTSSVLRIELQYPPRDDTAVMEAVSNLRSDAGEANDVLPSGDGRAWRFRKGRSVKVKVKQMHSQYRWRDRRGNALHDAADALTT